MRKEKKYHYIYKTTNLLNGRYYYGLHSSNELEDGYLGSGTYLRRAIRKYGTDNFKREIVEFCKTRSELKSREREIVTLQEIAKKECMNLRVGGSCNLNLDEFCGENHPMYGKQHSVESKNKMSVSAFKRITSEKSREKRSELSKGCGNNFYGKSHSDESKKKMSESAKVRKTPKEEERRDNISVAMKGISKTQEHSENIRKSKLGSGNPNYGKCWITNNIENKLIKRGDIIPNGYKLGRKIKT
jgi:hypothetical protein